MKNYEEIRKNINNLMEIYNQNISLGIDGQISDIFKYLNNEAFVSKTSELIEAFKQLHHHDHYEMLYIKKGKYRFRVDDKIYNIKPGDIILVSPSTLHVLDNISTNECERIVINFSEKYLQSISSENSNLIEIFTRVDKSKNYCITLKNDTKFKAEAYMQILLDNQLSNEFGSDLIYNCRFTQLMLLIYKSQINLENSEIIYENPVVAQCIEFINKNINKTFLISDIANFVNLSSSSISHTFKEVTGIPLHKFIIKKRMIYAKKLIKENYRFNEVYSMCGFNDYTSFFRTFKKEYGITPNNYKKNIES